MGRFMVECRRPWRSQCEFHGVRKHESTSANTSALRRARQVCLGSYRETFYLHGASVGEMLRRSKSKFTAVRVFNPGKSHGRPSVLTAKSTGC